MRLDNSPFFRSTVVFNRLFDMPEAADSGYPPYNIERSDETRYRISVAVAGFAEKDLGVEVLDGVLILTGKREDGSAARSYLHQGIAGRAFERRFQLGAGGKETPPDRDQRARAQNIEGSKAA